MELKKYTVETEAGPKTYTFVCQSKNTRDGFAHYVSLMNDGNIEISRARRRYLNRTWECFRYQSAMEDAVYNRLEWIEAYQLDVFKSANGYARMTAKRRTEFDDWRKTAAYSSEADALKRLDAAVRGVDRV